MMGPQPFELKYVLDTFVHGRGEDGKFLYNTIPTDTLYVTIDKEAVRKSGMMMATDSIPDREARRLRCYEEISHRGLRLRRTACPQRRGIVALLEPLMGDLHGTEGVSALHPR